MATVTSHSSVRAQLFRARIAFRSVEVARCYSLAKPISLWIAEYASNVFVWQRNSADDGRAATYIRDYKVNHWLHGTRRRVKSKKTYEPRRERSFVIRKSRWRSTQAWRPCSGSGLRKPSAFAECGVPRQWQKWLEEDDRRGRLLIRTVSGKQEKFFGTAVDSIANHWVASPRSLRTGAQARGAGLLPISACGAQVRSGRHHCPPAAFGFLPWSPWGRYPPSSVCIPQ